MFTSAPLNSKLYVSDIPFSSDKKVVVDSATIVSNKDSLILYVPKKTERLYAIDVKDLGLKITFINDAAVIRIHADYFKNKYTITGSKASISLKQFTESQLARGKAVRLLSKTIDSLKKISVENVLIGSLNLRLSGERHDFDKQYINYADTVKNPVAFMKVYPNIELSDDHKRAKSIILRAAARFPYYRPLQDYTKEVLATIQIYEKEYMIGDKLPAITLPDVNDNQFFTGSLKNQYYLIDFWSTWCHQCMAFKNVEKKIADKIPASKFQVVSVAIDDNKDTWKSIIQGNRYNWIQLIDMKMWQGPAVRTLAFDSIPFNFLVNPQGKIIKKAIPPDSLVTVISNLKLN